MLSSDNSHTELRALAFLFNIWDNLPIGCNVGSCTEPLHAARYQSELEFVFDDNEGLRWNVIVWLLSPPMWERYFCHWQPLVRAYYHRLLCWRVASVGPESDLLSSILQSNCNADARILLSQRLQTSYEKVAHAIELAKECKSMFPALEPAPPVVNRQLSIFVNPAVSGGGPPLAKVPMRVSSERNISGNNSINHLLPRVTSEGSLSSQHLHRVNPFDVFDDVAYSYPPMASPKDNLFSLGRELKPATDYLSHSVAETEEENSTKKKWSILRPHGLKKYFSSNNMRVSSAPTLPTETKKSMTSSSFVELKSVRSRTPSIKSSPKSVPKVSPTSSLTMSLIPPPPQLLRERPEINRPPFKFCIEYCEKTARKQFDLIFRKNQGIELETSQLRHPVKPRLPFDFDNKVDSTFFYSTAGTDVNDEEDDAYKTCASDESDSDDEFSTPAMGINDESAFDDITKAYDSNNEDSYETSSNPGADIVNSLLDEEKSQRIQFANGILGSPDQNTKADDSKYWRYAGRSLSEWALAVAQFEEFVRNRRTMAGVSRLEDLGVPFLVAEIPAKVLVG
ncbi:hypothetical protein AWJ20_1287 [Sugiyamaella lignohabitans]|uniref:Uncharacterized protein n=1 Tax=Sugiyamaella lignohabitans TaxID=796027 RepID=A0A167DKD1_9ASCO|nr:uncharacterized protein AWJ20_1287 [Sugiyamaella lignohabitans]ANB13009.1 hypothetical protein AWJ20_1287 [Sugiyamaella lignohabitans]